jgi:beta-barrel assembly-enhancing protease
MYSADYFDGKTSTPHPASVSITDNIMYIRVQASRDVHTWDLREIHKSEFQNKGRTIVKYGKFPFEYLEFEANSGLLEEIRQSSAHDSAFARLKYEIIHSEYKAILYSVIGLITFVIASYFVFIPYIAEKAINLVSIENEVKFGKKMFDGYLKNGMGELTKDSVEVNNQATVLVNNFIKNIDLKTPYPVHITVVHDDVINAFAMPGGNIVIFDEMIRKMDEPAQLAALIGHEVSHVNKRHSLKSMSRSLSNYLFLSVIVGDVSAISTVFVDNANMIGQMSYSRSLEEEADLEGLKIMDYNKIDQEGMVRLMEILMFESKKSGSEVPKFLSSHPLTEERIAYIKKEMKHKQLVENQNLKTIFLKIKESI